MCAPVSRGTERWLPLPRPRDSTSPVFPFQHRSRDTTAYVATPLDASVADQEASNRACRWNGSRAAVMTAPVDPVVSTVKTERAGAASSSPPATAATTKVCKPSARASSVYGDAHIESGAPSRPHLKLAPAVSEAKVKLTVGTPVVPTGVDVMSVSGAGSLARAATPPLMKRRSPRTVGPIDRSNRRRWNGERLMYLTIGSVYLN